MSTDTYVMGRNTDGRAPFQSLRVGSSQDGKRWDGAALQTESSKNIKKPHHHRDMTWPRVLGE